MHIQLIAATLIAALLWNGSSFVAPATMERKVAAPIHTETTLPKETHTAAEAEALALTHAGFTAEQVKALHTEVDYENGLKEFEVEFRSGDWEYDYTISAETLEILKHQKEYDPPKQKPAETKPAESKKISADEAKSIALAHAGLTADQVKGLRSELDRDDGRAEYDVEFRVGNWEYEYEIHAETGKILSWDKEIDD